MITHTEIQNLIGAELLDSSGEKVGKIAQIYLDDNTGEPEWATVNTGLFGLNESFVPLVQADRAGHAVRVPYEKSTIRDAPNMLTSDDHLDESQERELYVYFGLDYAGQRSDSGVPSGQATAKGTKATRGSVGYDTPARNTGAAMTGSEEPVLGGTEKVTAGKARLRKWVETEEVDVKVPVTKEKARLETEPITDADRDSAQDGPAISEREHEVTLTEERPVVQRRPYRLSGSASRRRPCRTWTGCPSKSARSALRPRATSTSPRISATAPGDLDPAKWIERHRRVAPGSRPQPRSPRRSGADASGRQPQRRREPGRPRALWGAERRSGSRS